MTADQSTNRLRALYLLNTTAIVMDKDKERAYREFLTFVHDTYEPPVDKEQINLASAEFNGVTSEPTALLTLLTTENNGLSEFVFSAAILRLFLLANPQKELANYWTAHPKLDKLFKAVLKRHLWLIQAFHARGRH
tara:strand:+ start:1247 stop:1654 length:408 start_codon:yes stop_codon:yes gene_type:complete